MKKSGEFKADRIETKLEWKEYAEELESLLLMRPVPPPESSKNIVEWVEEYKEWYSLVVESW